MATLLLSQYLREPKHAACGVTRLGCTRIASKMANTPTPPLPYRLEVYGERPAVFMVYDGQVLLGDTVRAVHYAVFIGPANMDNKT